MACPTYQHLGCGDEESLFPRRNAAFEHAPRLHGNPKPRKVCYANSYSVMT